MKRLITIFTGCAVGLSAMAADDFTGPWTVTSAGIATNVVTVQQKYNGFVDSVYMTSSSATSTSVLYMASARTGESIVSNSVVGSTVPPIRPRVPVQTTANVTSTAGTNAVERIKLVEEGIVLKLAEANAQTNTYKIYLKISDK